MVFFNFIGIDMIDADVLLAVGPTFCGVDSPRNITSDYRSHTAALLLTQAAIDAGNTEHPGEIYENHRSYIQNELPSLRTSATVVAKQLALPAWRRASNDVYREEIQPHFDVMVASLALPTLANVVSRARKQQLAAGDTGALFYVSDRVSGGAVLGAAGCGSPIVNYDTTPLYKIRTMHHDAPHIPGAQKGAAEAADLRILPGMKKFRDSGADEAAQLLHLFEPGPHHIVGMRALLAQDHDLAFSQTPHSMTAAEFAELHMLALSVRGIGLVGPMHRSLHQIADRDPLAWHKIKIPNAHKLLAGRHDIYSDLRELVSTGGAVGAKLLGRLPLLRTIKQFAND